MVKIGIIGGSGLEDPRILKDIREITLQTPYGEPSSSLSVGTIGKSEVVFLSRHGKQHTIPPTQVNYRANIYALKKQGCTHILTTIACGSLKKEIQRGDFVILDQFIDFTRHRKVTFFEHFEPGMENLKHTPMAEPFSEELRNKLIATGKELGLRIHEKGTVVTIEGPRFSTRAESRMFRLWGADVINMSVAPEVILANEAQIPYAAVALSTDYDCWKTDEPPVDIAEVMSVFARNVENVKKLLLRVIPQIH
ncbi:MAG: S-methyl-5'-thioadenosine phosphorylase [Candidatus Omnitrophota bacterium]